jgi:hypothetical protein
MTRGKTRATTRSAALNIGGEVSIMGIAFQCTCGKRFKVGEDLAGRRMRCKSCGTEMRVPSAEKPVSVPTSDPDLDVLSTSEPLDLPDLAPLPPQAAPRPMRRPRARNSDAVASNPGNTQIQYVHYLRCHWYLPLAFVVSAAVGVAMGLWVKPIWFCIPIFAAWALKDLLQGEARKLRTGDVCPAIVIAPNRVAVYTDLSTGGGECPAILIKRVFLAGIPGGPPPVGQRIAAIAMYHGNVNADAWESFDPTVVATATANGRDIARVTASIEPWQWQALEALLRNLPDERMGLHRLWKK